MERRWLISASAALALMAVPAMADETAPEVNVSPNPGVTAAPATEPAPSADAPAPAAEASEDKAAKTETATAAPVATTTTATTAVTNTATTAKADDAEPAPAPKFTYGGSADFYYSTGFNNPNPAFNNLRAFDFKDEHGPHIGLIDIWAQYARDPIGFRLDLAWGDTSRVVNFAEPTNDKIWQHIQQVYVGVNFNKKGNFYGEFGKWVTNAGAEVIEPKDNWLTSRGLLFNLAIPFYHMGGRAYYYFNDTDYVMGAIHRGWNAVSSPGHAPGFMIGGAKKMNSEWTLIGGYHGGDETAVFDESGKYRHLVDVIALYNPENSRWAYTFNGDLVVQGSATLFGASAQAKYAIDAKSYATARGEFLIDDGFLGTDVYSLTLGYARSWSKYFQTRAEFRYDFASEDVFFGSRLGSVKSNQGTFLISTILSY